MHTHGARCALPRCTTPVWGDSAIPVRVTFDGEPIVGLACSEAHRQEVERAWSSAGRHVPVLDRRDAEQLQSAGVAA